MIRNLNSSRQQLADGSHDAFFVQIAFGLLSLRTTRIPR
jgi:hypothetical protein